MKQYADSLYQKVLFESADTARRESVKHFHERAKTQGHGRLFSGVDYQALVRIYAEHIERVTAARLDSYQKSFGEMNRPPTEAELREILDDFKAAWEVQIKHSDQALRGSLAARNAPPALDLTADLRAKSARGHDRVLQEWKIWRDRVLLLQRAASSSEGGARGEKALQQEPTKSLAVGNLERATFEGDKVMGPLKILHQATKAVPAVKYALGIGGVVAVVALVKGFGIDYRVAALGAVVMFVLMTMLVLFAKLAAKRESDFHLQAIIFTWFALILTMSAAVLLFSSVFWGKPLELRYKGESATSTPSTTASAITPKTEAIPPVVKGGAAVGTKYEYVVKKSDLPCTGEYVKVSATDWQERLSSNSPTDCKADSVVFTYTERESKDSHYFLLYDEGRNALVRLSNTEKDQISPDEWRQPPNKTWNPAHSVTRVN